jgi:regulator of sigma E protease
MTALSAIILLGILIFVHELGHFLFAKLMNVKVEKFSLGFGPKLISRKIGETEYLICALPLGGYVKMLGENVDEKEDEESEEEELSEEDMRRSYGQQPVWKRFVIVFAGPIFNIFFAAFVFVLLFMSGVPVPNPDVGKIMEGSPAERAGFMTADRILDIDDIPVKGWDDIEVIISASTGQEMVFRVMRGEESLELSVYPEMKSVKNIFGEEKEIWNIGIGPLLYPDVGEVMAGTPAESAGLERGDRILEIDGTQLEKWQDMTSIIHKSPEIPLSFKIKRGDLILQKTIAPDKKTYQIPGSEEKDVGLIGIRPLGNDHIKRYNPIEAAYLAVKRTAEISHLTVVSLIKLVQRVIPADNIGGPILIFQMAGERASQGPISFFLFMAVISINLGIINLFPIPILDGGHILFLGIEAIRKKPLGESTMILAQKVGIVILLTIFAFVFYNDIARVIAGKSFP